MENLRVNNDVFLFYESGTHTADMRLEGGKIYCREVHNSGGSEAVWYEIDIKDNAYDDTLQDVLECIEELEGADWQGSDIVRLHNNKSFSKYIRVNGIISGKEEEAWIWASRGRKFPVDAVVYHNSIVGFILTGGVKCNILIKPGFECFTPLVLWKHSFVSEDGHGVDHKGTYYVKTRDGVNLATEVWLPSDLGEKKVPAVLIRTPYGRVLKNGGSRWLRFVRRGYALVIQDVRGREDSEGEWSPYKYDREDGDDTLNWIAEQPWSDGNAGTIGGSYLGCVQWAAASSGNPHLKAIVSMVTSGPAFIDINRRGGIYTSGGLAWAFMMADRRMNRKAMERDDWDDVIKIRPIKRIPEKALGRKLPFWEEELEHPDNDEFWKNIDWSIRGEKIDVPSIIISGWYDDNGMGSTAAWEMNEKNNRKHQKLIFGPWKHAFNTSREIHGVEFGNNAVRYDLDILCLRWFDRFLKGMENGVEYEPAVQYYLVGENKWKESSKWPPENAAYRNFYMHSMGHANTSSGDGTLDMVHPAHENTDVYVFNPQDPAPFLIDVSENEMNVPGNYRDVDLREDVLVYTSKPLDEDLIIAGNVYAEIYASSSARDTDWLIRLEDVDNVGNSIRLVDGILRARYRNSFEKQELLCLGKVEKYEIRMAKTANVFKAGHSIRVTITSGAEGLAFPNHNTGNNPADDVEMISAVQTVYHNDEYPSHVKLPVILG